jgi:flavin reductase (DIM6/NTAB) family NADH-FMN oxidoreductase RutF
MEEKFKEIHSEEIKDNPFTLIGKDFMLVTAGTPDFYNTMTAAWGGFGVMWSKHVTIIVIRPTRYTYEFLEKSGSYSLSFFGAQYRDALMLCGTKSGRNVNKVAEAGLTAVVDDGPIYFKEARLVLQCRKLYFQDLQPSNFLDAGIEANYPQKDYHRWYVGEVERCLIR